MAAFAVSSGLWLLAAPWLLGWLRRHLNALRFVWRCGLGAVEGPGLQAFVVLPLTAVAKKAV